MSSQQQFTQKSNEGTRSTRGLTRADKKVVRRKLTVKCIETKYLAVLSKKEMNQTAIARQFKLPANTLSTLIKSMEEIKTIYLQTWFNPDRQRILQTWFNPDRQRIYRKQNQ
jgi:DNA-binding MarR family transcriptional regulator